MNYRTEIFAVNNSLPAEIQSNWQYRTSACARPAADLGIPILCETNPTYLAINGGRNDSKGHIWDEGTDWQSMSRCCPPVANGSNIWRAERNCVGAYCYTHDVGLAKGFDKCVQETAQELLRNATEAGLLPKNSKINSSQYSGRCEWIDYEAVKGGVSAGQREVASVKILVGLVAVGLIAATSGMF